MPDGAGMNVPFDPNGLQYLEQFKAASQEASRRLSQMDKEMDALIKKGNAVGSLRFEAYAQQAKLTKEINEAYTKQKKLAEAHTTDIRDAQTAGRLVNRLQHVLNSPLLRKLSTGEAVTGTDVFREIIASERATAAAARLLGGSAQFARALAPAMMIGFAAYEITSQIMKQREMKEVFAQAVQREVSRGEIGAGMLQEFQRQRGKESFISSLFGIDNAKENFEALKTATKVVQELDQTSIEAALNAGTSETHDLGLLGSIDSLMGTGQKQRNQNEAARNRQFALNREQAGTVKDEVQKAFLEKNPQNQKDRDIVVGDTLARLQKEGLLRELDKAALEALKKAIDDKKTWHDLVERSKTPDQKFYDSQVEAVDRISWNIHRRRVSAAPTD